MRFQYKYKDIKIKKLLSTGPYEHSINFKNSTMLSNFLGRKNGTTRIAAIIRNKQYIIADNLKNYYVIVSYNGIEVNIDEKLQKFYNNHIYKNGKFSFQRPLLIPTKEQVQESKIRHAIVGRLLSLIEIKYGGVDNAEGTKEFSELQKLLNTERD